MLDAPALRPGAFRRTSRGRLEARPLDLPGMLLSSRITGPRLDRGPSSRAGGFETGVDDFALRRLPRHRRAAGVAADLAAAAASDLVARAAPGSSVSVAFAHRVVGVIG